MFCNKCGASLNDGDMFCRKCGNKIVAISGDGNVVHMGNTGNAETHENQQEKTRVEDLARVAWALDYACKINDKVEERNRLERQVLNDSTEKLGLLKFIPKVSKIFIMVIIVVCLICISTVFGKEAKNLPEESATPVTRVLAKMYDSFALPGFEPNIETVELYESVQEVSISDNPMVIVTAILIFAYPCIILLIIGIISRKVYKNVNDTRKGRYEENSKIKAKLDQEIDTYFNNYTKTTGHTWRDSWDLYYLYRLFDILKKEQAYSLVEAKNCYKQEVHNEKMIEMSKEQMRVAEEALAYAKSAYNRVYW